MKNDMRESYILPVFSPTHGPLWFGFNVVSLPYTSSPYLTRVAISCYSKYKFWVFASKMSLFGSTRQGFLPFCCLTLTNFFQDSSSWLPTWLIIPVNKWYFSLPNSKHIDIVFCVLTQTLEADFQVQVLFLPLTIYFPMDKLAFPQISFFIYIMNSLIPTS